MVGPSPRRLARAAQQGHPVDLHHVGVGLLSVDVEAARVGGNGVLLRLKSGRGWRFRMSGADLKIEDGVYLGDGRPRKTRQIVLYGHLAEEALAVHWAFGLIESADA